MLTVGRRDAQLLLPVAVQVSRSWRWKRIGDRDSIMGMKDRERGLGSTASKEKRIGPGRKSGHLTVVQFN